MRFLFLLMSSSEYFIYCFSFINCLICVFLSQIPPLSAVNASPTCISSQGDLVSFVYLLLESELFLSALLSFECNLWWKHNWFALTNVVICYYAGVSWVEVQSSNHGSPVTKDQRGECGEDHAIWALHHGVRCLPCHQGAGPRGTAWPAWVYFLSLSPSSLTLCFTSPIPSHWDVYQIFWKDQGCYNTHLFTVGFNQCPSSSKVIPRENNPFIIVGKRFFVVFQ